MRTLEEIAYDAAERALDKQEKTVEELRARTGVLLAASSLAVSFLGGDAFTSDATSAFAVIAVLGFAGTVLGALRILLPDERLVFFAAAPLLYERMSAVREDGIELHRRLAFALSRAVERNARIVTSLERAYRLTAAALLVESLALIALTSSRIL